MFEVQCREVVVDGCRVDRSGSVECWNHSLNRQIRDGVNDYVDFLEHQLLLASAGLHYVLWLDGVGTNEEVSDQ